LKVKISDKITLVLTEQGFTYSNWLIINDDVKAIIDVGFDERGLEGLNLDSVDLILCSHHHKDHIRGCKMFDRAKVMVHELEVPIIGGDFYDYTSDSIDLWDTLMPNVTFDDATTEIGLNKYEYSKEAKVLNVEPKSFVEGQTIDFGTVKAQVIHLPGHTAGHCGFWFPEEEFLFSADVCLTKAGPWYGERKANPLEMQKSIDRIIELNPSRLATGHVGKIITDCGPVLAEYRERIDKRTKGVYRFLREKPCNIHELAEAKLIYSSQPTRYVVFWEKLNLLKHIELLELDGLIKRDGDVFIGI
jgi:glyoxylase-like metal-dependent hydrolase (beta-lactamase superfamily II)